MTSTSAPSVRLCHAFRSDRALSPHSAAFAHADITAAAVDLLPSPGPVPPAAAVLPGGEDVVLHTDDGLRLSAWFFPAAGGGPAVLVCNGNGGDRTLRAPLAAALRDAGVSVLLFDYRGYGGNPGRPTEDGLAADAEPPGRSWRLARKSIGLSTSASRWARRWRFGWRSSRRRPRWCCARRSHR